MSDIAKRLREWAAGKAVLHVDEISTAADEIERIEAALAAERERARVLTEGLDFYGDRKNWDAQWDDQFRAWVVQAHDNGKKARAAIRATEPRPYDPAEPSEVRIRRERDEEWR